MAHTSEHHTGVPFAELDVVRVRATVQSEGQLYPSGTLGVIVLVHRDGRAFEVELSDPSTVVTLEAGELEPAQ